MSPSPAEMVRMACAEVGIKPNVRDSSTHPGVIETLDALRADYPAIRKAGLLVNLRLNGPNAPVLCADHSGWSWSCRHITVAEALLDPTLTCTPEHPHV